MAVLAAQLQLDHQRIGQAMTAYIVRRLGQCVVVLLGVTLIAFPWRSRAQLMSVVEQRICDHKVLKLRRAMFRWE